MPTAVAQHQAPPRLAHQDFTLEGDRIYAHAGPGSSVCAATCATPEDAQALVDLIQSLKQDPSPARNPDRPEWFERRGNMVYGEDTGPGSAPHIATCTTASDANTMVMVLCELATSP